jgi:hypothetical protein
MVWPAHGTLTAKEILGMEPDELKTRLDGAATKDDLTKATSAIEQQGNALSEIRTMLNKLTAPPPPEPDPATEADANDPTTQILTDPSGFVGRQTAGLAEQAAETRADVLEMRARTKYPQVFAKWGDQLLETARKFSASQRAQQGFWEFHLRTFTGDKLLKGEIEAGSYPSLVGSSSFAPNSGNSDSDPNKGFSPDQVAFFKEHGVPLDRAAKIKNLVIDNGESITLEAFKNSEVAHA